MSWVGWGRRRGRNRPSSGDPVGDAVTACAGTVLRARWGDDVPVLEELPGYVSATDDTSVHGFNTRVDLDDEIHAFVDPGEDGLEAVVAEHPGVVEVFAEDREVLYLSTTLALADVHALLVRAVVDVNQHPRPASAAEGLDQATLDALADQVAGTLEAAGFRRRDGDDRDGRYFNRIADDGFVHVLMLGSAAGRRLGDGTVLDWRVWLFTGVVVPELSPTPDVAPRFCYPADCVVSEQTYPLPDQLPAAVDTALSWLAPYRSCDDAAAWFAADPARIFPPMNQPRYALLFAKWGLSDAAARVLAYLDQTSKHLAHTRDAAEARDLLGR